MNEIKATAKWFETNKLIELLSAAEFTDQMVAQIDDAHDWRWAIIGMAFLLNGSCVSALHSTHTASVAYYNKAWMKKWQQYQNDHSGLTEPPSRSKIASTKELLKRCKSREYFSNSIQFEIPEKAYQDCKRLIDFRDEFTHFRPKLWSIETSGFSRILRNACLTSESLIKILPNLPRNCDPEIHEKILIATNSMQKRLEVL